MCIITVEEQQAGLQHWLEVTKTNIFARHTRPGFQAIAYSLSIASRSPAAMILPLPVVAGSGEGALAFIDLSGYETFFDDLHAGCEPECCEPALADFGDASLGAVTAPEPTLTVHEVGDFEASYVPRMTDFTRLDRRFRLPDEIWRKMPDYSDYGFAVFQLKLTLADERNDVANTVHPMAFEFPTRDPARLYFPTVHVHDGDFHDEAGFFHRFYCQRDDARAEFKRERDWLEGQLPSAPRESGDGSGFFGYDWYFRSTTAAAEVVEVERSAGIIDPDRKLHAMALRGRYPNADIWLGDSG